MADKKVSKKKDDFMMVTGTGNSKFPNKTKRVHNILGEKLIKNGFAVAEGEKVPKGGKASKEGKDDK